MAWWIVSATVEACNQPGNATPFTVKADFARTALSAKNEMLDKISMYDRDLEFCLLLY